MTTTVVNLSPFAGAGAQFFDNNGVPLSGGLLYTYAAGTTTQQATYTTPIATVANSNPIVLDASGRTTQEIWLLNGYSYKFVLQNANATQIGSYDNIPSTSTNLALINDASSVAYEQGYTITAGSFVVGKTYLITSVGTTNFQSIGATSNTVGVLFTATGVGSGTGTAQLSRTVQSKLQETVSVTDFGADPTGTNDSTAAINYCIQNNSNIYFPPGLYKTTGILVSSRPRKITGSGPIGSTGDGTRGTLIWNTNASGPAILVTGSDDCIISDIDIVSAQDGLSITASNRGTYSNINVLNGTSGNGFLIENSVESRFLSCTATTNGVSPSSYTTGYSGLLAKGFSLIVQTSDTYGIGATEFHGCIASGCTIGFSINNPGSAGSTSTYINIFGGTLEGNGTNLYINNLNAAQYNTNVWGTHIESPITCNINIINSSYININSASVQRTNAVYQGLQLTGSFNCTFTNLHLSQCTISSSSQNNTFTKCSFQRGYLFDNGVNTLFIDTDPDYNDDQNIFQGSVAITGQNNLIQNGYFNNWYGNAPLGGVTVGYSGDAIAQSSSIYYQAPYSLQLTSAGNASSGIKYVVPKNQFFSPYMTVSFWVYVASGNTGDYGLRINNIGYGDVTYQYTLPVSNFIPNAGAYNTWIRKQYTVYIGLPGFTQRGTNANFEVILVLNGGTTSGGISYVDGVTISDGKTASTTAMINNGEIGTLFLGSQQIIQSQYNPSTFTTPHLQGDIVWNSGATAGGYAGYICVSSGTPGTWKTFGLISS